MSSILPDIKEVEWTGQFQPLLTTNSESSLFIQITPRMDFLGCAEMAETQRKSMDMFKFSLSNMVHLMFTPGSVLPLLKISGC